MNSKELQAQLDNLNKIIFETAVRENAGRYITNETVKTVNNNIAENLENAKLTDKIVSVNAMIDFHQNRGVIIKCKTPKSKRLSRLYSV